MEKTIMFLVGYFFGGSLFAGFMLMLSEWTIEWVKFTYNHWWFFVFIIPFWIITSIVAVSSLNK